MTSKTQTGPQPAATRTTRESGHWKEPADRAVEPGSPGFPLVGLQKAAGNTAVVELLHSRLPLSQAGPIAAYRGLEVAPAGGPDEQEADQVARTISHPTPATSPRQLPGSHSPGRAGMQGGQALSPASRVVFESLFRADLSTVRVHTGAEAASSADLLAADAFTVGDDIVFGAGQYTPDTPSGRALLGHELTHVLQHRSGAGSVIHRKRRKSDDSSREATIKVRWSGDQGEFYRRILTAVSRGTRVPESSLMQSFHPEALRFHAEHQLDGFKEGRRIKLKVSLIYAPGRSPSVWGAHLELAGGQASAGGKTTPTAQPAQQSTPEDEKPQPNESTEQRLNRQGRSTVRSMGRVVADADTEGYDSIEVIIDNDGKEIVPGFEKRGPKTTQTSGRRLSAERVTRETLMPHMQIILTTAPARHRFLFKRDEGGEFHFQEYKRLDPQAQPAPMEEDLDLPDRKKIYGQIFEQTKQELKEAGIMIAGFAVEQVVFMVLGGGLLRVLKFAGTGVARAFPYLRQALKGKQATRVVRAINALGEAEAREVTTLMTQAERGALSATERARLSELLSKVESHLASEVKAGGSKSGYTTKEIVEDIAEQTGRVGPGEKAMADIGVTSRQLARVSEHHHLLVQQLRRWFKKAGVNIDKYTVKLSADEHRWIHNEYKWNELWKDFMKKNPKASADEIMQQMADLQKRVGLEGLEIVPYPR